MPNWPELDFAPRSLFVCGLFLFFLSNNVLFSNFNDDFNQIDCTNVIHDGKRFKWISNWETLKNFIEYNLPLKGIDGLRRVAALESLHARTWI